MDVYKNMLQVWDGKDYLNLLRSTKSFQYKAGHNDQLSAKSFDEMIELCGSNKDWLEYYDKISKLDINFKLGNLLSEVFQKKLIADIDKNSVCLFNVSNIFNYESETFWIDIFQRYFSFF
jgi:predicted nucleic acid-binding protein